MKKYMRSNNIQIWKIIFTYIIMVYHFLNNYQIITGWYIGVEFFFLVSGYLLADSIDKYENPYIYLLHRVKKLYPHYCFSFLIAFAVNIFFKSIEPNVDWILTNVIEMLCIQGIGFNLIWVNNVPTWYVSIMLIAGFFIFGFYKYHKKFFINMILPAVVIIYISYMYRYIGCLQYSFLGQNITNGIYGNIPLFRGFATMGMGVLCNCFVKYSSKNQIILNNILTKTGQIILLGGYNTFV